MDPETHTKATHRRQEKPNATVLAYDIELADAELVRERRRREVKGDIEDGDVHLHRENRFIQRLDKLLE